MKLLATTAILVFCLCAGFATGTPNYDMFGFDSTASDFRMNPALTWGQDSLITCMDVSPDGDLVLGGKDPSNFPIMSLMYHDSSLDYTTAKINEANSWSMGYQNSGLDQYYEECKFTPELDTTLQKRLLIVGFPVFPSETSPPFREYQIIDPNDTSTNGFTVKAKFHSPLYHNELNIGHFSNSEKLNTEFGVLQTTNIISIYVMIQGEPSMMSIHKFIVNTQASPYTIQDYRMKQTISSSLTRTAAFLQRDHEFYFALTVHSNTPTLIFIRVVECSSCAGNDNLATILSSYDSNNPTNGGTVLYQETLTLQNSNSNAIGTVEVMADAGRMIAVGNVRQMVDGDVSNIDFGILSYFAWCPSSIERMDISLPDNEQTNPLALYAPSLQESYLLAVVDLTGEKKLKVVKITYPQDATCSLSSITPTAQLINLELTLFTSTDLAQVVLARFDSSYSALFIGGKAATIQNSADTNRGFLDGVSLGYIDSLTTTALSISNQRTISSGTIWAGSYFTESRLNHAESLQTIIVLNHQCLNTISLVSGSWATSGYVLDIIGSTEPHVFPVSDLFQSSDATNCPILSCTAHTFADEALLHDLAEFDQQYCTADHASNVTFVTDSVLNTQIDISTETYDFKLCLKCGNAYSKMVSNVFSVKVTNPCRVITIAANSGWTPGTLSATQLIVQTDTQARNNPPAGQTPVTLAIDMFPDPSATCLITSYAITKVVKTSDSSEVAEATWSPIISLTGGSTITVIPPEATTVLPFTNVEIYVQVNLDDKQSQEFQVTTLAITEVTQVNTAPYFAEDLPTVELEFEYYPFGPDPDAQFEPRANETMEITPPEEKEFLPVTVSLPVAKDNDQDDYIASLTLEVPILYQSVVTFDSATNTTSFDISTFSYSQVKLSEFELKYTLTDRWGLASSFTQTVKLDVDLVYETRTFTEIEKKENPQEVLEQEVIEEEPEKEEEKSEEEEEKEEEAAPQTATGLVFPGIKLPDFFIPTWIGEDDNPPEAIQKIETYLPLRASISDITTLGLFTVQFNQAIQSDLFELEEIGDSLFFEIVPGDYEKSPYFDITNLDFIWEAVKYDKGKNQLLFQVNFTNAMYISAEDIPDEMGIRVVNPDAFRSAEFDRRISYSSKNMWSPVKKQMPNNEASQGYDQSTTTTEESMSTFTIINFALSLVLKGALKEITSTILSLQIIINLFLLAIPFPANSINLVSKIKNIVSFDVLKSFTLFTLDIFPLDHDRQAELRGEILDSMQNMGTKSHNAMPNLGNMSHLLGIYFFMLVALPFYKFRGIGSFKWGNRYIKVKQRICYGQLLGILIQGFLPITIAVYFQLKRPLFTTSGEKLGFCFGVSFFILEHVWFPMTLLWILTVPKEVLEQPDFQARWGRLYTKARYDTIPRRAYLHVYIIRRLLLLSIGLFLFGNPTLQILSITTLNIINVIYLGLAEPQASRHDRRMDIFNEVMVVIITYNLFMFTDALPDRGAQYFVGWVFAGSFFFMLLVNAFFAVINTIIRIKQVLVRKYRARNQKKKQQIVDQLHSTKKKGLSEEQISAYLSSAGLSSTSPTSRQRLSRRACLRKMKTIVALRPPAELSIIKEERDEPAEFSVETMEIYTSLKQSGRLKSSLRGQANQPLDIFTQNQDEFDDDGEETAANWSRSQINASGLSAGHSLIPSRNPQVSRQQSEKVGEKRHSHLRKTQRETSEFERDLSRRLMRRKTNEIISRSKQE